MVVMESRGKFGVCVEYVRHLLRRRWFGEERRKDWRRRMMHESIQRATRRNEADQAHTESTRDLHATLKRYVDTANPIEDLTQTIRIEPKTREK